MVMDRHCDEHGYELCRSTKLCSSAEGTCSFTRLSGDFDEIEGITHFLHNQLIAIPQL